jgi:hypothetical protein
MLKKLLGIRTLTMGFATIFFLSNSSALAISEIAIDYETKPFDRREIASNSIKVSVSYHKQENYNPDRPNLEYTIYFKNKSLLKDSTYTYNFGRVFLQDLDGDRLEEVLVSTYTGGAHCCTNFIVYQWRNNKFIRVETGESDGEGGVFKDLNGDGKIEFITYDNSFLYAFSSYAGSGSPTVIYSLGNGKFQEVTRQYQKYLKEKATELYRAVVAAKQNDSEINGILAAYVAQKITIGEYKDAWEFMLKNYDRTSDWGLTIYDPSGKDIGKYPDYPTALRAFLITTGYLAK